MASGTKFMKEISDQFLICKICSEPFKEPKTLSCLHSFCLYCLQKQADASNDRPSRFYSRYLTCPLCRQKTEIPTGGIRRLPDNFLVCSLTEVVNRRQRAKVPPCEICQTVRTKSNDACSKCLDCSKLLCKACVELHGSTKVTQKHSLIDIQGEKNIECKSHPEEIVRFYCEPCEACICVVCAFQDHRNHEVCSFSDGFDKYKSGLDLLLKQGQGRMADVDSRIKMIDKYQKVIKETRENIRDLAISYIAKVRQTEKALLKKVDDLVGDNTMEFLKNRNWLQENWDNLNNTCNLTQIIMKDNGVEMLLLKQEIQAKMATLLEPELPDLPKDIPSHIRFVPGDVKLGHISISEGKDHTGLNEISDNGTKFQQTQTEHIQQKELSDGVTTMSSDMTVKLVDGSIQTPTVNLVSRDTSTEQRVFRDKGISVYIHDTRAKGTMTDRLDLRSLKCQTERINMFDQETNTARLILPSVDVMVNTPVAKPIRSSVSKGLQVQARMSTKITNTESLSNGKESGTSSTVTEMIPNNSETANNNSEPNRSQKAKTWVHSRKIQTDISAMGSKENDSNFVKDLLNEKGLSENSNSNGIIQVEMKDAEVNTLFNVRIVPEMTEKDTSTELRRVKDVATTAFPQAKTTDTQTQRIMSKDIAIATDYSGQSHKATSTQKTNSVDCYTQVMPIKSENKITWTEKVSTCDRATCPMCLETSERATSTTSIKQGEAGTQVTPQRKIRSTNTPHINHQHQESQTNIGYTDSLSQNDLLSMEKLSCSLPNLASELLKDEMKVNTESKCVGTNAYEWDGVLNTSFISSVSESVDTISVLTCEKETSTPIVHCIDQWTLTTKPQLVNTGVSPPRPATIESETSTNPIVTVDSSTHTEVITQRESATETYISLTDNETLTERISVVDAQSGVDIIMESTETSMDIQHFQDQGCMTCDTEYLTKPELESVGIQANMMLYENEDITGSIQYTEVGIQTSFSAVDCATCEHQFEFGEEKQKSANCCMGRTVPHKHDVGTMAMSVSLCLSEVMDHGTQTLHVRLLDKSIGTSLDFDELEPALSLEHRDAATSTESLPYIGLLSELDVDDLIVVPEAHFDLLSIYSTDDEDVEMVDDETSTDICQYVEAGTQTLLTVQSPEPSPTLPTDFENSKHLVSIGVNTVSKMTFEKETCTPIRHLFSKGTMTFYISKMDKSTSTFSYTRQIADSKFGGSLNKGPTIPKIIVEDKHTMTSMAEYKDIAIETDSTLLDGKITKCISKLRNVSEKLNSPTISRQSSDDFFFGRSFTSRSSDSSDQSSSTLHDSMSSSREEKSKQGSAIDKPESERQKQIQQLLAQTNAILNPRENTLSNRTHIQESPQMTEEQYLKNKEKQMKGGFETETNIKTKDDSVRMQNHGQNINEKISNDSQTNEYKVSNGKEKSGWQGGTIKPERSPVRKAQPITTLKGRGSDKSKNNVSFETHSLPRQYSGDTPLSVKMGSQLVPPSRLPLLRYNSAPGRIATVPTQKLQDMQKSRYSPVRTSPQRGASPSKIPIKAPMSETPTSVDVVYSPKAASKSPQPRPSLPSISETRTLSSCSDTSTSSFVSADSGDSATPSLTVSTITTSSDQADANVHITATSSRSSADNSSIGSAEYTEDGNKISDSRQTKKTKNFMQRLLSKKKKEPEQESKPEPKSATPGAKYRIKQTPPEPPKQPAAPKKPRPFVYVRQRIFSIQHDNEEEMNEKRKKSKQKKILEQEKKKEKKDNQSD